MRSRIRSAWTRLVKCLPKFAPLTAAAKLMIEMEAEMAIATGVVVIAESDSALTTRSPPFAATYELSMPARVTPVRELVATLEPIVTVN